MLAAEEDVEKVLMSQQLVRVVQVAVEMVVMMVKLEQQEPQILVAAVAVVEMLVLLVLAQKLVVQVSSLLLTHHKYLKNHNGIYW
jgi:chorismate synthase